MEAGELANMTTASANKIVKDEKKLIREGKDVLDGLVKLGADDDQHGGAWVIQLNGM